MFRIIELTMGVTGPGKVKNLLEKECNLFVREIADLNELLRTSHQMGRVNCLSIGFPANCLVRVFVGDAEPEPYAEYLAEVKKLTKKGEAREKVTPRKVGKNPR